MNLLRSLFRNLAWVSAASIVGLLSSTIYNIVVARYLGDILYGKLAFAISFTVLFTSLGDLGTSTLAIREVAKNPEKGKVYVSNLTALKLLVGTVLLAVTNISALMLGYRDQRLILVAVFSVSAFLGVAASGFKCSFQAFQKFEYAAITSSIVTVLTLLAGLAVVLATKDVVALAIAVVCANLTGVMLSLYLVRKKLNVFGIGVDWSFLRQLAQTIVPFALLAFAPIIYLNLDTVLLAVMQGDAATGWYSAATRLINLVRIMPGLFLMASFPVFAAAYGDGRANFERLLRESFYAMFAGLLGVAVAIGVLSDQIVLLVYGRQFLNSAIVLRITIWGVFFANLSGVLGQGLISAGLQYINVLAVYLGLGVNVGLNLLLIPRWGYVGSSVSLAFSELMVLLPVLYASIRSLGFRLSFSRMVRTLVAVIPMGLLAYVLSSWHVVVVAIVCVLFYLTLLLILGAIGKENLIAIKHLVTDKMTV